jgi:ubiquitin carboxyl-terminal hydrolase L5
VQFAFSLTLLPRSPIYGVIFLFKYLSTSSRSSEPADGKFDFDASENIFFAQQTIQNACGTQALLSVLLNLEDVDVGVGLKEFRDFTSGFPSEVCRRVEGSLKSRC